MSTLEPTCPNRYLGLMPPHVEIFDLESLGLVSGQAQQLEFQFAIGDFERGGEQYSVVPTEQELRIDVSRTTGNGYALRLRFKAGIRGRCVRCLDPAQLEIDVNVREVQQPGDGEELESPYVDGDGQLDVAQWARDALILALPTQITCRVDCAGLCPECGINLNEQPEHHHERAVDSQWEKLSEIKFE